MKRTIAMAALIGSLALVGCSAGGTALDREVDVEGLTLSVPSTWIEDGTDYEFESLGSSFGHRTFDAPEGDEGSLPGAIIVGYSNDEHDMDPDEYAEDYLNDIEATKEDEMVIDGAECVVYDASIDDMNMHVAFILDMGMTYEITVIGDEVSINDVLETVSVE